MEFNPVFARFKFNSEPQGNESIEQYVTRLKLLAKGCNFKDQDDMIRDRIVVGVSSSKVREELLNVGAGLTLKKALQLAQHFERAQEQLEMSRMAAPNVHAVQHKPKQQQYYGAGSTEHKSENKQARNASTSESSLSSCGNCGYSHSKCDVCPAKGKKCDKCKKLNHFVNVCRSKPVHDLSSNVRDDQAAAFANVKTAVMSPVHKDLDEVRDGVYVGCWQAAENVENLLSMGIKYILTLGLTPLEPETVERFVYKFVPIHDDPEADLLTHFDDCFKFIDEALSVGGRKILIHCVAGVSRSATVAIAYIMHKDKLSLKKALSKAKHMRPTLSPNEGFMEQLELFERMGSVINPCNDLYRKYKLGVMAQKVQSGGFDKVMELDLSAVSVDSISKTESYYKCRKCRQALFRSSSIMYHSVGQGEAAFDWRSKVPASRRPAGNITGNQTDETCDQSLFIEPVQWMASFLNQLEGKLMCPKCQTKLGSFIWYGEKCPCGSWVAPAFHIQSSKVDLVKPRPQIMVNQSGTSKTDIVQSEISAMSGDLSDMSVKAT